jgi:hypothetical protein
VRRYIFVFLVMVLSGKNSPFLAWANMTVLPLVPGKALPSPNDAVVFDVCHTPLTKREKVMGMSMDRDGTSIRVGISRFATGLLKEVSIAIG